MTLLLSYTGRLCPENRITFCFTDLQYFIYSPKVCLLLKNSDILKLAKLFKVWQYNVPFM